MPTIATLFMMLLSASLGGVAEAWQTSSWFVEKPAAPVLAEAPTPASKAATPAVRSHERSAHIHERPVHPASGAEDRPAHFYRASFRVPDLSPPLANRLRVRLGEVRGIMAVTPDVRAGTITVIYPHALVSPDRILEILRRLAPESAMVANHPAPEIHLPGHKCGNPLHRH